MFVNVPINALVEVTYAVNVALELVLVASTRNSPVACVYSASVIATVSGGGVGVVGAGVTVNVALALALFKVALITAELLAVTTLVVTVNEALLVPAGTTTLAGTVATAELLLANDTVAPPGGAAPLNVTVAVDDPPPITVAGLSVNDVGVIAPGVAVTNRVPVTQWFAKVSG